MLIIFRNIHKLLCYKPNIRCISSAFCVGKLLETEVNTRHGHAKNVSMPFTLFTELKTFSSYKYFPPQLEMKRNFSKKKRSKRSMEEVEEESDTDDDEYEENLDQDDFGTNAVKKTVPSLRMDSILKAGLGVPKKKIEKEFYAGRIRVNGNAITKKAVSVSVGDEVDLIKSISPENHRLLIVSRVIMKSIGKITGTGNYPISMEVFKELTIENYEDPWRPSSIGEMEER